MRTQNHPPTLIPAIGALVLLAVALILTGDMVEVVVVAIGFLMTMSYLAHRYVRTQLGWQYPRHGARMD